MCLTEFESQFRVVIGVSAEDDFAEEHIGRDAFVVDYKSDDPPETDKTHQKEELDVQPEGHLLLVAAVCSRCICLLACLGWLGLN